MTTLDMAREEREQFAQLLDELTPTQWEHHTLCELWRVLDVVAHVISYDDLNVIDLAGRFISAISSAERGAGRPAPQLQPDFSSSA